MKLKKISSLKTGTISRNWSFAKMVTTLGKDYYFAQKDKFADKLGQVLGPRVNFLMNEIDHLKGSFLKAGQMLSLYASDLLPKELQVLLEKLQSESSFLEWKEIKKQIPKEILEQLEIEPDAFAAASIGQVHRAKDKQGKLYAVKIQYKGLSKSVDSDLKMLNFLITTINIIPNTMNLEALFDELKVMLKQELNYNKEREFMKLFKGFNDPHYIIPQVYDELSNTRVITSEYIHADSIHEVLPRLSHQAKERLAKEFFELFLKEVFLWKTVQTDAHMGNFLIQDEKWVLLDFGATKKLSKNLYEFYTGIINAMFDDNFEQFLNMIETYGAVDLANSDQDFLRTYFQLLTVPMKDEMFDWATSDAANQVLNVIPKVFTKVKFHYSPFETVFIDRKTAGVYYMLKKIGVPLNLQQIFRNFIKQNNLA